LKLITSNCYKAYFHQNMNCNPLIFMGMRLPCIGEVPLSLGL
jgi:hypothetical protein